MVESQLVTLVNAMKLRGDSVPLHMIQKLFEDKGNDLDQKCCHCGILYENVSKVQTERGVPIRRDVGYQPLFLNG